MQLAAFYYFPVNSRDKEKSWLPMFHCELKCSKNLVTFFLLFFFRSSSAWKDTALCEMPYVAWWSFPVRLCFMNLRKPVKRSKNKCLGLVSQRKCFLTGSSHCPFFSCQMQLQKNKFNSQISVFLWIFGSVLTPTQSHSLLLMMVSWAPAVSKIVLTSSYEHSDFKHVKSWG